MNRKLSTLLFSAVLAAFISITSSAFAQPGVSWLRRYDANGDERLYDVFVCDNGDFTACGTTCPMGGNWDREDSWVIRVDSNGNPIWSTVIGMNSGDLLESLVESDAGDIVTVGNAGTVMAAKLSRDGDLSWQRTYLDGIAYAVIELKEGSFVMCGRTGGDGFLLCFDDQGEVIWQRSYTLNGQSGDYFFGLREVEGGIVAAGMSVFGGGQPQTVVGWLVKTNFQGQTIWNRSFCPDSLQTQFRNMCSRPGGFATVGNLRDQNGRGDYDTGIYLLDENCQLDSYRRVDVGGFGLDDQANCVTKLPQGRIALTGTAHDVGEFYTPYVKVVMPDGRDDWTRIFSELDTINGFDPSENMFGALTTTRQNELIAAGKCALVNQGSDGLLLKLEPLFYDPTMLYFLPVDTAFCALIGDSIQFVARVGYHHADALSYIWLRNGEEVRGDTSIMAHFDDYGEEEIECRVIAENSTISVRWHVKVTWFFISDWQPDTLQLTVARHDTANFGVNVRAVSDETTYRWTLTDLQDNQSVRVGDAESVSVCFERPDPQQLECVASLWDTSESVIWRIDVRSLIVAWAPLDLAFTAPLDSVMVFEVVTANHDSVGAIFEWLVDGELSSDSSMDIRAFHTLGEHRIAVKVTDGEESDSLEWRLTVYDPNAVGHDVSQKVEKWGLLSVSPNPFNSSTSISYVIPTAGRVQLTLYDLTGREIQRLVDDQLAPGNYSISLNGSDLPPGLYFLKLESASSSLTRKLVLLK